MTHPLGLYVEFPTKSGTPAKGFIVNRTKKYCYVFVEEGTPNVKKRFVKVPPNSLTSQGRGSNPDVASVAYYPKRISEHSKFYVQDMETDEIYLFKENLGRGSCYAKKISDQKTWKMHVWRFRELSEADALRILASASNPPQAQEEQSPAPPKDKKKSEIVVGGSVSWTNDNGTQYGIVISKDDTDVKVFSEGHFLILNLRSLEGFSV